MILDLPKLYILLYTVLIAFVRSGLNWLNPTGFIFRHILGLVGYNNQSTWARFASMVHTYCCLVVAEHLSGCTIFGEKSHVWYGNDLPVTTSSRISALTVASLKCFTVVKASQGQLLGALVTLFNYTESRKVLPEPEKSTLTRIKPAIRHDTYVVSVSTNIETAMMVGARGGSSSSSCSNTQLYDQSGWCDVHTLLDA